MYGVRAEVCTQQWELQITQIRCPSDDRAMSLSLFCVARTEHHGLGNLQRSLFLVVLKAGMSKAKGPVPRETKVE